MCPSASDIEQGMKFIRQIAANKAYIIGSHAFEKMGILKISIEQIECCLLHGCFIEYQNGYSDRNEAPRVLIYSGHDTEFYLVVGLTFPECYIISVIKPDWAQWSVDGETIKRTH